jgi:hypothetical protein
LIVGALGDPVAQASRLLPVFAEIAATAAERQTPLWLVTSGAQQPGGDQGIVGAALWGFGRVLRNETPGLVLRPDRSSAGYAVGGAGAVRRAGARDGER